MTKHLLEQLGQVIFIDHVRTGTRSDAHESCRQSVCKSTGIQTLTGKNEARVEIHVRARCSGKKLKLSGNEVKTLLKQNREEEVDQK